MNDSFKLENKKLRNKKLSIKKCLIYIVSIILIFLLLYIITMFFYHRFFYINKRDSKKDYVYTFRKDINYYQDDTYSRVPNINIEGDKFDKINKNILSNYLSVIEETDYDYDYEFNISKNILSLKISYAYFLENEMYPKRYFKTYNINLNNGHIYTDEELLDKYNITSEKLNSFLEYKFESYYSDLIKYEYFDKKECDYNCYLKNRGISNNYLDDINLYVDHGSLTLYKFFYTYSEYEEEGYFSNVTYRFLIKK